MGFASTTGLTAQLAAQAEAYIIASRTPGKDCRPYLSKHIPEHTFMVGLRNLLIAKRHIELEEFILAYPGKVSRDAFMEVITGLWHRQQFDIVTRLWRKRGFVQNVDLSSLLLANLTEAHNNLLQDKKLSSNQYKRIMGGAHVIQSIDQMKNLTQGNVRHINQLLGTTDLSEPKLTTPLGKYVVMLATLAQGSPGLQRLWKDTQSNYAYHYVNDKGPRDSSLIYSTRPGGRAVYVVDASIPTMLAYDLVHKPVSSAQIEYLTKDRFTLHDIIPHIDKDPTFLVDITTLVQ